MVLHATPAAKFQLQCSLDGVQPFTRLTNAAASISDQCRIITMASEVVFLFF